MWIFYSSHANFVRCDLHYSKHCENEMNITKANQENLSSPQDENNPREYYNDKWDLELSEFLVDKHNDGNIRFSVSCFCSVQKMINSLISVSINLKETKDFCCSLFASCVSKDTVKVKLMFLDLKKLLGMFWFGWNFPLPDKLPKTLEHYKTEKELAKAKENFLQESQGILHRLEVLGVSRWLRNVASTQDETRCQFDDPTQININDAYFEIYQIEEMKTQSVGEITYGRRSKSKFLFHCQDNRAELLVTHPFVSDVRLYMLNLSQSNAIHLDWVRMKSFVCENKKRPEYASDADMFLMSGIVKSCLINRFRKEISKQLSSPLSLADIAMTYVCFKIDANIKHGIEYVTQLYPFNEICVSFTKGIENQVYPFVGYQMAKIISSNVLEFVTIGFVFTSGSESYNAPIVVKLSRNCKSCTYCCQ